MSKSPNLLELQNLKSRADKAHFSSYVVRLMLRLYHGLPLDGRQRKSLRTATLLEGKTNGLTFYGKLVMTRLVRESQERGQRLLPEKEAEEHEIPLWRRVKKNITEKQTKN